MTNSGRLTALRANQLYLRCVQCTFGFHNAADLTHAGRLYVLGYDVEAFNDNFAFLRADSYDLTGLSALGLVVLIVERFKSRAEKLIFYVFPVGFTYDMEKFIWDDEEEFDYDTPVYATEQEQIEEAEKRIYYITGRTNINVSDFKKRIKDSCSMKALENFYNAQKCSPVCGYPFWIVDDLQSNKAILYVGANKATWFAERCGIDFESRRGYIAAYVYNTACPELSEYGEIEYKYRYRTMLRVA